MNKGLILAALLLTACGSGGTYTSDIITQRPDRCFSLEKQCRFSDNADGCIAIKQTPEQGAEDDAFYAEFCAI